MGNTNVFLESSVFPRVFPKKWNDFYTFIPYYPFNPKLMIKMKYLGNISLVTYCCLLFFLFNTGLWYASNNSGIEGKTMESRKIDNKDDEALRKWWKNLSPRWKAVFMGEIDSAGAYIDDIKIELSEQPGIFQLQTLHEATSIYCADMTIGSLAPIKDFSALQMLDCSQNPIISLKPLRFLSQLSILNIARTKIVNLFPLSGLPLKELYMDSIITLHDIRSVENLYQLEVLTCSHSPIRNIDALKPLKFLSFLDVSQTEITNTASLAYSENLEILLCFDNTITSIEPLKKTQPFAHLAHRPQPYCGFVSLG